MYEHYDNFLEEHVAQLIDFEMKEVKWEYDYDSKPNGTQKHWHVFCGHNIDECNLNGYDFIEPHLEQYKKCRFHIRVRKSIFKCTHLWNRTTYT